jgi:hypothetical protein
VTTFDRFPGVVLHDPTNGNIISRARSMTVFNTGPNAMTMDFNAGDIGSVRKTVGHYVAKWPDNSPGVMPNSGGS